MARREREEAHEAELALQREEEEANEALREMRAAEAKLLKAKHVKGPHGETSDAEQKAQKEFDRARKRYNDELADRDKAEAVQRREEEEAWEAEALLSAAEARESGLESTVEASAAEESKAGEIQRSDGSNTIAYVVPRKPLDVQKKSRRQMWEEQQVLLQEIESLHQATVRKQQEEKEAEREQRRRQREEEKRRVVHVSASRIQATLGIASARHTIELRIIADSAASRVQSMIRGRESRSEVTGQYQTDVSTVQGGIRGHNARVITMPLAEKAAYEDQLVSARRIAAAVQGSRARMVTRSSLAVKNSQAASSIQCAMRGHTNRRVARNVAISTEATISGASVLELDRATTVVPAAVVHKAARTRQPCHKPETVRTLHSRVENIVIPSYSGQLLSALGPGADRIRVPAYTGRPPSEAARS